MKVKCFSFVFAILVICMSCGSTETNNSTQEETTVDHILDLVVAKDGNGDYTTIQAAIDAAPKGSTQPFTIFIKAGTYKEVVKIPSDKTFIRFKGEGTDKTIIRYGNYAKKLNGKGKEYGTSGSASVFINGNNFIAEDLTFENTAGMNAGQALAVHIGAPKSAFKNCWFLGNQDTYYAANGTVQYLKDCFISGTVDFIFGGSTAFFENCNIHSLRGGYLTAASTPRTQKYGYVFYNCKLTAKPGLPEASVYLGRPWRPYAYVVFIDCEMDGHIKPEGWHNWGNPENEKTARYAEYGSYGAGYQVGKREAWSKQLSAEEAKAYTKEKVLGDWDPFDTM